MHTECFRMHIECSRMHAECSRMFQNACKRIYIECSRMHAECSRMHTECSRMHQECSRMFQNACRMFIKLHEVSWACMQFHEHPCSFTKHSFAQNSVYTQSLNIWLRATATALMVTFVAQYHSGSGHLASSQPSRGLHTLQETLDCNYFFWLRQELMESQCNVCLSATNFFIAQKFASCWLGSK